MRTPDFRWEAMMKGFENFPELGEIFERWGQVVQATEAKRMRRRLCLARPSQLPYMCSQERIAAARALEERQLPDPKELPTEPSPPLVPEYVSPDEMRGRTLAAFMASARSTKGAVQLSLL